MAQSNATPIQIVFYKICYNISANRRILKWSGISGRTFQQTSAWPLAGNELYGPSIGVPESPELVDDILSLRLNYQSKNKLNKW